jgi:small subunit ribosomal protein S30e
MPTHGSLTKAGKVRNQTPKVTLNKKKSQGPARRNHRKYVKMLENKRNNNGRYRRRRRR